MSHLFPTIEALGPQLPRAKDEATGWVVGLGVVPARASARATGWTPPEFSAGMAASPAEPAFDLDAARRAAEDAGFRAGYFQGQAAGTERGLAEGRKTGREEGHAELLAAQSAALEGFREALAEVVADVGPAADRWKEAVESRATELAMDAVRSLLAAELVTRRPDALAIVREALGHAEGAVRATVRLAPFDRAALAERKDEILQACAGLRDVELVDDRSIEGGCVVETEQGIVDATLATRLALLEAA